MAEAGKKVEVRFGAFSCSIEGYDDPVQQMREVLLMMQQMMRETPALVDHGPNFDEDELARIEHALDRSAQAGGSGRIVIRGAGRNGREEAEDAVTTAEIPPERGRGAPERTEAENMPAVSPVPAFDGPGEAFAPTAAASAAPIAPEAARSEGDAGGEPERPFGGGTGAEPSEAGLYAAPLAEVGDGDFAEADQNAAGREPPEGAGEEHARGPGEADGEEDATIAAAGEDAARPATPEHESWAAVEAEAEEGQPEPIAERDTGPADTGGSDREGAEAANRRDSGAATETAQSEIADDAGAAGEALRDPGEAAGARPDWIAAEATEPARPQPVNIFAPPPEVQAGPVAPGAAVERGRTHGIEDRARAEAAASEEVPEPPKAGASEDVTALEGAGTASSLAPSDDAGTKEVMAPSRADGGVDRDRIAHAAPAPALVTNIFAPPETEDPVGRPEAVRTASDAVEMAPGQAGAYGQSAARSDAAAPNADRLRTAGAAADDAVEHRAAPPVLLRPSMPLLRGADGRAQAAPPTAAAAAGSVNMSPRRESPLPSGWGESPRRSEGGHADELRRAGALGAQGREPREPDRPPVGTRGGGIPGLLARLTGRRAPEPGRGAAEPGPGREAAEPEPGRGAADPEFLALSSAHRVPASPDELAELATAQTVADLMAVAAAWLTLVEGRARFTRREAMDIFSRLSGEHLHTRQARILGFGQLVRTGRLVASDDGTVSMSKPERERFLAVIDGG